MVSVRILASVRPAWLPAPADHPARPRSAWSRSLHSVRPAPFHLEFLQNPRRDHHHLQHRKVASDTDPRPTAEGHVATRTNELIDLDHRFIEAAGAKLLRLRPILFITVQGMATQHHERPFR